MPFWSRTKAPIPTVHQPDIPPKRLSMDSEPDLLASFNYAQNIYASMANRLPFELYDYVELVAMYNPDYSQAVDNIKNLANPGFKTIVNSKDQAKAQEYRDRLKQKNKNLKPRNGGFDGIINGLLRQGAVYGAMSGEWVANATLDDVVDFAFVNPKYIRFFWDEIENDWHPYQKITYGLSNSNLDRPDEKFGCVRLNTNTFFYQALYTYNNNPYGIPPLIAALDPLGTQREMTGNLKSITKKLGMLGILEVIIERLPQEPDETPQEYMNRCSTFLTNYQGLIKDMVNEGGIVHFDDTKIDNLSIAERAQGGAELFKLNEEQVFSGLHSLPSVQGRSYSTTETYAGVAYELLLRSIGDFTAAVKFIMEHGCWLMDKLWGIGVDDIDFNFGENKSLNLLQNSQAEAISLTSDMWMWENGLLDQTQVGQRHGIDVPARPMVTPATPPQKGGQTMAAQAADAIYKNALNINLDSHEDAHTVGAQARQEYTNNLIDFFEPVKTAAQEVVDDAVRRLS